MNHLAAAILANAVSTDRDKVLVASVVIFDPETGRPTCTTDRWCTQYPDAVADAAAWLVNEIESDLRFGRVRNGVLTAIRAEGVATSARLDGATLMNLPTERSKP